MISIKAFASNLSFTDNKKDIIAPVGELSAWSATYARDRAVYRRNIDTNIVLTVFSAKDDGQYYLIPSELETHIHTIVQWLYQQRMSAPKGQPLVTDIVQSLTDHFSTVASHFKAGEIAGSEDGIWLPSWISWKRAGSVEKETNIRIWFSDESFQNTYDEFEIVVIPPLSPLSEFFKLSTKVREALDNRTPMKRMDDIQAAKAEKPETVIRTELYHYVDPHASDNIIPTYWDILVYGEYGNNVDSIKDAVINHILNNSTQSRDEWTRIFPDIFKRTEFVILPHWDKYAIPNRVTEAGIYAPTLDVKDLVSSMRPFTHLYPASHVAEHCQVSAHPYRSLALTIVGSNENRDNKFKITDFFPDYIAQASTSQDFNRQSEPTRTWAELLSNALLLAEEMTPFSDVPRGFNRLEREGKLFVVFSYDNVHYLVACKHNFQ